METLINIITWPRIAIDEIRNSEYEALAIGLFLAYQFIGVPQSGDSTQQLAMWYFGTGALVAGSKFLVTGSE